jgi:hypothetical protein
MMDMMENRPPLETEYNRIPARIQSKIHSASLLPTRNHHPQKNTPPTSDFPQIRNTPPLRPL